MLEYFSALCDIFIDTTTWWRSCSALMQLVEISSGKYPCSMFLWPKTLKLHSKNILRLQVTEAVQPNE
jgi:hypothetical protein